MIMAGGAGERLQPLTRERSKGAVPFGGKFRLVDLTRATASTRVCGTSMSLRNTSPNL